jgi:hypothetical protein
MRSRFSYSTLDGSGTGLRAEGHVRGRHRPVSAGVKLSGSPLMMSLLGHAYAASGKKSEARRILAELDKQKQRYVSPYTVATIYAGLGEKDQAFKWLEKAFEDRGIWLMNLKVDPVLKSLRSDQRSQIFWSALDSPLSETAHYNTRT